VRVALHAAGGEILHNPSPVRKRKMLVSLFGSAAVEFPWDYDFRGPAPLPVPTDAPPGSRRKIRVLTNRFRRREELFHPLDARGSERLAFRPGKNSGPHGDKFRAAALLELSAGALEC
jgi:hypothetical protein